MLDRFAVLAAAALCLLAPGVVQADDDDFTRSGFYASAGALLAIENFADSDGNDLRGGFDLHLGYRANEIISVETEFEWAGFWQFEGVPPDDDSEVNLYTWSANVKGNIPLGRIQPYGVVGFGFYRVRAARGFDSNPPGQSTIGGMMKAGLGVDFYVTRRIVLSPEFAYSALFNGNDGYDYMGAGVSATYRF